jgi:1-acyl-sn-glycerol-3-phosphate acyltransferase
MLPAPFNWISDRTGLVTDEIRARIDALEIPFNRYGLDAFGLSKDHLGFMYGLLVPLYRRYFRVRTFGVEHVPARGRALVVGNHSGGVPVDAAMVLASLFLEREPPRHAHGMVELFAQTWPFVSEMFCRAGQFPGLPDHALRFLDADRVVMVFPEGARGTGKLYKDRYQLVRFGTGFVRVALQTGSPIVPFAFIGGEEAMPTVYHAKTLARLAGTPYWPVPPWGLPVPLPMPCDLHFGSPIVLEGDGHESDEVIESHVSRVRAAIVELIERGRAQRRAEGRR